MNQSELKSAHAVLDDLIFPEVPRWRDGRLWFSDFQLWPRGLSGEVMTVERDGAARTVIDQVPGGPATGLGWLPDGRLLVAAAMGRSLQALQPDGTLALYADLSGVTSYLCNELVVDASGRAYVASADLAGMPHPSPSQLFVVYPGGRVEVADSSMSFPNGMAITPDGRTLIVAESTGQRLTAFTIAKDGSLGGKRLWAAATGMVPGGICLDQEGCVWFADSIGGACVRVAEGGEVRDRIETDQDAFACALGGDDGRTLFVTTSINLFRGGPVAGRPGRIVSYQVDIPGTGSP